MFIVPPEGWDAARYRVEAAPAGRILEAGDVVDLGDRAFEAIHTPGHSPGGIALFERASGVLFSGDIVYDGPLIDDAYHSTRMTICRHLRGCAGDVRSCTAATSRFRADPLPPAHRQISCAEGKPGCHL